MPKGITTPYFLTKEVADVVIRIYISEFLDRFCRAGRALRKECHIIILVPAMDPFGTIKAHILYEKSFGNPSNWPHDFAAIARSKSFQLWNGQNDGQTDCMPHLLLPGDTPWWGGVKRDGIVVACSGFQPHFDRMIAGMAVDMCIAIAYDQWKKMKGDLTGDFLS